MIIGVWNPKKRKAWKLLMAYLAAAHGRIMSVERVRGARTDHLVFYGVDEVTKPVFDRVAPRRNFTYIDNGYFATKYHGNKNPYYRVTRGQTQHSGLGTSDGKRFAALDFEIEPWRRDGDHVLVALQSEWWFSRHHLERDQWLASVVASITTATGRPVVVRDKPGHADTSAPIAQALAGAWCVVTHSSNVAIDAIVRGIPAIVLGASAARPMAGSAIHEVANPPMPKNREQWAGVLADNQWTRPEIARGDVIEWLDANMQGARRGNG